jgi:hypothetical protein
MDDAYERPLTGGWVTSGVVRLGNTVRRPRGPNAEFVEQLLQHLELVGFDAAPRHLGLDEQGRDILTYITGDVPSDCRALVWADDELAAIARLLRRFHDATAGSAVASGGEVVCHNDFGPWNLVWRRGRPIGIIDYDNAAPGSRLEDVGYAMWKALNLALIPVPVAEQKRRAQVFAAAYGASMDSYLVDAVRHAQERMRQLLEEAPAGEGREAALEQNLREREWLQAHGSRLIA